jgi:hypothetical protein
MENDKLKAAFVVLDEISDYKLINELQQRIVAALVHHENGRGCLAPQVVAKYEALNAAINGVKVHW